MKIQVPVWLLQPQVFRSGCNYHVLPHPVHRTSSIFSEERSEASTSNHHGWGKMEMGENAAVYEGYHGEAQSRSQELCQWLYR